MPSGATATSVPTIMTSLQPDGAPWEETGQATTAVMLGSGWHFVEDFTNDLWNSEFNFNFDFPIASPDNMSFQAGGTYQAADETPSFPIV